MKEFTTSGNITVRLFSDAEEQDRFYDERGYQLADELNVADGKVSGDIIGQTCIDALHSVRSALAEAGIDAGSILDEMVRCQESGQRCDFSRFDMCREDACDMDDVWYIRFNA